MEELLEKMRRTVSGLRGIECQIEWVRRQDALQMSPRRASKACRQSPVVLGGSKGNGNGKESSGATALSRCNSGSNMNSIGSGSNSSNGSGNNNSSDSNNINNRGSSGSVGLAESDDSDEALLDTVRRTIECIDTDIKEMLRRISPQLIIPN